MKKIKEKIIDLDETDLIVVDSYLLYLIILPILEKVKQNKKTKEIIKLIDERIVSNNFSREDIRELRQWIKIEQLKKMRENKI